MMHSYLSAGLRNLVRNKFYSTVSIFGLALGFVAVFAIFAHVNSELRYERFIPDRERIYRVSMSYDAPGRESEVFDSSSGELAELLKQDFAGIQNVTRLLRDESRIRVGDVVETEVVYWADPDFFSIFAVPVVAGDLSNALTVPDGVVITREVARRYFGAEVPIGKGIELGRDRRFRVMAVIDDLPLTSHFDFRIVVSGRAANSKLSQLNENSQQGRLSTDVYTYIRLRDGASIAEINAALPEFTRRHFSLPIGAVSLQVLQLADIHLSSKGAGAMKPPGDPQALRALVVIGLLIATIAVINFVNLMTAKASQRAVEVAIRKVAGAEHRDLFFQFMGETFIYVTLALVVATLLGPVCLLAIGDLLGRSIAEKPWQSLEFALSMLGGLALVGLLAGIYPSSVLSSMSPRTVLNSGRTQSESNAQVRYILVAAQFGVLVALLICTGIVFAQTKYATQESVLLNKDNVLLVEGASNSSFVAGVTELPGVEGVTRSMSAPTDKFVIQTRFQLVSGASTVVALSFVDHDFFDFYGLRPLAGSLSFRRTSNTSASGDESLHIPIVINETAVRSLGFVDPSNAVNQLLIQSVQSTARFIVVGVVPDFPIGSVRTPVLPTIFLVDPNQLQLLSVRLSKTQTRATLESIRALWETWETDNPLRMVFLAEHIDKTYEDIRIQTRLLALFSFVALIIASLGLFGRAAHMAQRKTKEIGVRKAFGATTFDAQRFMLWQFIHPVLVGSLLAWPIAGYFMYHWLQGFAYRVAFPIWLFPASAAVVLFIAAMTVGAHVFLVSRESPAASLRYE